MSYPPLTGHATATESFWIQKLIDEWLRFFREIGYRGVASIEYKILDPDDLNSLKSL